MFFKFLAYFMMAFFLMSSVVQLNDADWPMWLSIYAAILIATVLKIFYTSIQLRWFLVVLLLIYGFGVVYWSDSFVDTSIDAFKAVGMKGEIEERVRELWGLVICFIWTIVLTIHDWQHPGNSSQLEDIK
jgi:hypothetical protein